MDRLTKGTNGNLSSPRLLFKWFKLIIDGQQTVHGFIAADNHITDLPVASQCHKYSCNKFYIDSCLPSSWWFFKLWSLSALCRDLFSNCFSLISIENHQGDTTMNWRNEAEGITGQIISSELFRSFFFFAIQGKLVYVMCLSFMKLLIFNILVLL